jgi:hypothetical protein
VTLLKAWPPSEATLESCRRKPSAGAAHTRIHTSARTHHVRHRHAGLSTANPHTPLGTPTILRSHRPCLAARRPHPTPAISALGTHCRTSPDLVPAVATHTRAQVTRRRLGCRGHGGSARHHTSDNVCRAMRMRSRSRPGGGSRGSPAPPPPLPPPPPKPSSPSKSSA